MIASTTKDIVQEIMRKALPIFSCMFSTRLSALQALRVDIDDNVGVFFVLETAPEEVRHAPNYIMVEVINQSGARIFLGVSLEEIVARGHVAILANICNIMDFFTVKFRL